MSTDSSQMITSRFEIDRDGQISYLAYETDSREWLSLLYTEVAPALCGRGIATELARVAFEYARANCLKVEVIAQSLFISSLSIPSTNRSWENGSKLNHRLAGIQRQTVSFRW
jgi:predicted GNAT family acetyltransferase